MDKENDVTTELKQRLASLSPLEEAAVRGAADADIQELEAELQLRFPQVYRRFLEAMGRSAGPLFRGSEYSFDQRDRLRLRRVAQRIVQDSGSGWKLPEDVFVFLVHHGYQFLYFPLGQGDDPPVYRFSDADATATEIASHLSDFLRSRMDGHEQIVRSCLADEPEHERARA